MSLLLLSSPCLPPALAQSLPGGETSTGTTDTAASTITYAYRLLPFDPASATQADLLALAQAQAADGYSFRGVQRLAEGLFALLRRTDDPTLRHALKVKLVNAATLAPDGRAATLVANLNRYGAGGFSVLDGSFLRLAEGAYMLLERDVAGAVVPACEYDATLFADLDEDGRVGLSGADFLAGTSLEGVPGFALYKRYDSRGTTPDLAGPHTFFLFSRPLSPDTARRVEYRLDDHLDPATTTMAAFLKRLNKRGKKGFSLRTVLPLADGDFDLSERAVASAGRHGTYTFTAEMVEETPTATHWEAILNAHGAQGERFDLKVGLADGFQAFFFSYQDPVD